MMGQLVGEKRVFTRRGIGSAPVLWLETAVALAPGGRVRVLGVSADMPASERDYWLGLAHEQAERERRAAQDSPRPADVPTKALAA